MGTFNSFNFRVITEVISVIFRIMNSEDDFLRMEISAT